LELTGFYLSWLLFYLKLRFFEASERKMGITSEFFSGYLRFVEFICDLQILFAISKIYLRFSDFICDS
jgi:hypothetical protein